MGIQTARKEDSKQTATFSAMWSSQLGAAILELAPKAYPMSLRGEDCKSFVACVNQGIDSHLEACFVPTRGDSFQVVSESRLGGRITSRHLNASLSAESLAVLVRRLLESESAEANSLANAICASLGIELV